MSDWLKFLLLVLACYRVAQLLAYDEGPFSCFRWIRIKAGSYDYGANGEAETALGRFMACPYCLGVWIALFLAVSFYSWSDVVIYWLAIAGGQAFLQEIR